MHDYWSFRPERPQFPEAGEPRRNEPALTEGERETDLEAVQGMIKRLASEVSLGESAPDGGRSGQESALRASVDALYSTADTMRAATIKGAPAPRRDGPMPPPIAPGHARLSSVAEAIAAQRTDVYLEPIVGLADHQLHHYEITIRPRDENGAVLPLVGQDRQLSRTGLLPLIDAARLKWAARMASSFAEKGQKHCVFSSVSAESLTADRFLDELATIYRQRDAFAGELVLMFSQADVKAFSGVEWSALTDMRDLGFSFGLGDVTDLDYEFTALRAAGFAFVKLDAVALLNGLAGPGGLSPPSEACRYFGEMGLTVIVDNVRDEASRTAVTDSGVPLGQGPLFGPPVMVESAGAGQSGNAAA
jgi:cyclic-di-GMP phosphodiesterase TipF (flagellum assembly factor)